MGGVFGGARRIAGRGFVVWVIWERLVKKSDIVERVAGEVGVTKRAAEGAIDAVFAAIAEALARGEDVTLAEFGRFSWKSRPARQGRNPRTGELVAIGLLNTVSFRAGRALKDALN